MDMNVKVTNGRMPVKKTEGAAGFDLCASSHGALLVPGHPTKVGTGVYLEIPKGYFGLVKTRSGFGSRGIIYLGSGTIDWDYRGEIILSLMNLLKEPVQIMAYERVCQILILPVPDIDLVQVSELGDTARGEGGFGHTGSH